MHDVIRDAQLFGNGMDGHCFIEFSDEPNICFRDFRRSTFLALMVIDIVLGAIHILKIVETVIESVFVYVVNLAVRWARANEGEGDQFMNVELSPLVMLEKPKVVIATFQAESLVFGAVRLGIAALSGNKPTDALDLPVVTDLIQAFVSRNVAPFCKFKLELGTAWGMIIHSRFSFQNLLTPPNDSRRCGGNFIGYYSFIIAQRFERGNRTAELLEASR